MQIDPVLYQPLFHYECMHSFLRLQFHTYHSHNKYKFHFYHILDVKFWECMMWKVPSNFKDVCSCGANSVKQIFVVIYCLRSDSISLSLFVFNPLISGILHLSSPYSLKYSKVFSQVFIRKYLKFYSRNHMLLFLVFAIVNGNALYFVTCHLKVYENIVDFILILLPTLL